MKLAQHPSVLRRAMVALVLFFILVATLFPAGHAPRLPFSFQLGVGERWLADVILNVFLFVPLGLTLGWNTRSPAKVVLFGLLLSTAVELAQIWIPGRDSSLSDIIANTSGTALGALLGLRPRTWINPSGRESAALTILGLIAAVSVMTVTARLLAPAGDAVFTRRSGNDLEIQYSANAAAAGLDQPEYWVPDAFRHTDTARAVVRRDGAHWQVSMRSSNQTTVGPTVGEGWALLAYPDAIGRRWRETISAIWLFGLCIPIGFYSGNARLAFFAAACLAVALIWIPEITGIVRTPVLQWLGGVSGFFAGRALRSSYRRILRSCDERRS